MIELDIFDEDDSLLEVLKKMISGMLPHDNFDPTHYGTILQHTLSLVNFEEMRMEYYVIFSALIQMKKIQISSANFLPRLGREVLHTIMDNSLMDAIQRPELGARQWLRANMMEDDLTNELHLSNATTKLYERVMELYDEAFEMALDGNEALSYIPAMKLALIGNVSNGSLRNQVAIRDGFLTIGRKTYSGPEGWLDYIGTVNRTLKARLEDSNKGVTKVDSIDKLNEIMEQGQLMYEKLAMTSIVPIDNSAGLLRHRLIVIAANEGIGKTLLAVHITVVLLLAGKKVVFMYGESTEAQILHKILSCYILLKYHAHVPMEQIAGAVEPDDEEIKRIIQMAKAEVVLGANLILKDSFGYYTLEDELEDLYQQDAFDAAIFDHTKALSGGKKEYEDIGTMAIHLRNFKRRRPVLLLVLSHLSSMAKELLERGKRITTSPTKGSSSLSGEADDVWVLNRTQKLKERGMFSLDVTKTRATQIPDIIILRAKGAYASFVYDPRDQDLGDRNTMGMEAAIESLETFDNESDAEEHGYLL
jgi:hypothetical protein